MPAAQEKEIIELKEKLLSFMLAYMDMADAVDYAASEGFEWPSDPITPDVKYVMDTYGSAITKTEIS